MSRQDPRVERIRALIEEADHVRDESERVMNQIDRAMKHPVWPDRRRSPRIDEDHRRKNGDQ